MLNNILKVKGLMVLSWLLIIPLLSCGYALNGTSLDPSRDLFNARQIGMGGVSIGFANDANGVFSDPSSLVKLEFPQLTATSRNIMLDETQYSLLSWAMPTNYGTFGIGYIGMSTGGSLPTVIDGATGRIVIDPSQEAGSYLNSVMAFSYSRQLEKPYPIAVGGNLKLFNQFLSGTNGDSASGFGLDLSANYQPYRWLKVGAVLQNLLGGSLSWKNSSDKMGGYYRLGGQINVLGASNEALRVYPQNLKAGLEIEVPSGVLSTGSSFLYHLGMEYFPLSTIALRAGINQDLNGSGLTLGVGVINGGFRFDYAFSQRPGLPGDTPHYFTLSYIGERVLSVYRKLKSKSVRLVFHSPHDRLITDQPLIYLSAEAWAEKKIEQKRVWTVTAISSTQDAFEVSERENLSHLYLNGKDQGSISTLEALENIAYGRNVLLLSGQTLPEDTINATIESSSIKVLRIAPFVDVSMESWALEPIAMNTVLGLITGYPDNSYKPDKGISRAELVALLVRSLNLPSIVLDQYGTLEVFSDVPIKHWANKFIVYGNLINYVTGYPDRTFKPNRVLSRAEGITIMSRYAGLSAEAAGANPPYPDLKTDFWANKYISPAKKAGLLKYLEGKNFNPAANFTRAEAAEVLYRVPAIQKKVDEYWETGAISGK